MTVSCDKSCFPAGPFVYGFLDLFSGSGESWHWGLAMEANGQINSTIDGSRHAYGTLEKAIDHDVKPLLQETKQGPQRASTVKLDILEEESEDESKTTDSRTSLSNESVGNATISEVMECWKFFSFDWHCNDQIIQ